MTSSPSPPLGPSWRIGTLGSASLSISSSLTSFSDLQGGYCSSWLSLLSLYFFPMLRTKLSTPSMFTATSHWSLQNKSGCPGHTGHGQVDQQQLKGFSIITYLLDKSFTGCCGVVTVNYPSRSSPLLLFLQWSVHQRQ